MLYRLYHFFAGSLKIVISGKAPARALDLLFSRRIPLRRIRRVDEETVSVYVPRRHSGEVRSLLEANLNRLGIRVSYSEYGMPRLLYRYRARIGLALGIAAGIFFITLSTFFIWSVKIETNTTSYDLRELSVFLEEAGIRPGISKAAAEAEGLALRFRLKHPEFIFVSFNVVGTQLHAELMEREVLPEAQSGEGVPCHLTAKQGGVIRFCEVYNGEPMVHSGDAVNAGDLLVSGTMTLREGGYRLVESRARILAETYREFSCTVPFSESGLVCTGNETVYSALHLLGRDLSPFSVGRAAYEKECTTEEMLPLKFFGAELPLSLHRVTHIEEKALDRARSEERAREIAFDRYRTWLSDCLGADGELIKEEYACEVSGEALVFRACVFACENIVQISPFSYSLNGENGG